MIFIPTHQRRGLCECFFPSVSLSIHHVISSLTTGLNLITNLTKLAKWLPHLVRVCDRGFGDGVTSMVRSSSYCIYLKYIYSDTSLYHTHPKISTSPFYYLVVCLNMSGKQCWFSSAFWTVRSGLSLAQVVECTCLTLLLLNTACPVLANSVDPDQLEEAN